MQSHLGLFRAERMGEGNKGTSRGGCSLANIKRKNSYLGGRKPEEVRRVATLV